MRPKIIFSRWTIGHRPAYKEMCAVSNYLAKKHNYETILFADAEGIKDLKNIKYDHIEELDNKVLNTLPKSIWSLGKIYTMSRMTEPFIHMDFDFFMYKNILKEYYVKPFFGFHMDTYIRYSENFCKRIKGMVHRPAGIPANTFLDSYNFSVVGVQPWEVFADVCNEVLAIAMEHKDEFNEVDSPTEGFSAYTAIIFEQCWIPYLMKLRGFPIETILEYPWLGDYIPSLHAYRKLMVARGITHFPGLSKKSYEQEIVNYAKKRNLKY